MKGVKKNNFSRNMTSLYAKEYIQCSQATFFCLSHLTPQNQIKEKKKKKKKHKKTIEGREKRGLEALFKPVMLLTNNLDSILSNYR